MEIGDQADEKKQQQHDQTQAHDPVVFPLVSMCMLYFDFILPKLESNFIDWIIIISHIAVAFRVWPVNGPVSLPRRFPTHLTDI